MFFKDDFSYLILKNADTVLCCRYIIVVEHDLSVLDYLSDYICCLYGSPGAYGVVTMPFSVREGKFEKTSSSSITSLDKLQGCC